MSPHASEATKVANGDPEALARFRSGIGSFRQTLQVWPFWADKRQLPPDGNWHGWLKWRTGAEAFLYSGEAPEKLRGPEHHFAWCDELAKWGWPKACWDMLQMGMRLGETPRTLVTTTPRPLALLRQMVDDPGVVIVRDPAGPWAGLIEHRVRVMVAD